MTESATLTHLAYLSEQASTSIDRLTRMEEQPAIAFDVQAELDYLLLLTGRLSRLVANLSDIFESRGP